MPSIHGPMTLGELIKALEASCVGELEEYTRERIPAARPVYIDWNLLRPTRFASYRGYYDHLAIGFDSNDAAPTVAQFLDACRKANGVTFEGYKGGEYLMTDDTPVWVSKWGEAGGWGISGVQDDREWAVLIKTEKFD